ncbi:MAG: ABC transporter permease subunit [Eubacterium sp.]|nr:ABC transporter permease subunit [Eubacterium sp.]
MRGFRTFFKKEMMELFRTYRWIVLGAASIFLGILGPLTAKLTPWIYEQMGDTLAEQGIEIREVIVTAKDSWSQFIKNMPMLLIVVIAVLCGSYVNEYAKGTLIPLVTKGLTRVAVVLSKFLNHFLIWTASFWLTFGMTWGYTAYFWDNSGMKHFLLMGVFFWLMGIFLLSVLAFFSSFMNSSIQVLLGVGVVYFIQMLVGMIGTVERFLPTYLMGSGSMLTGEMIPEDYLPAAGIASGVSVVLLILTVVITKRRKI